MARNSIMTVRPRAVLTRQQYYETPAAGALLDTVSPEWSRCMHGHDRLNTDDIQSLSRDNNNVVGEAYGWNADYAGGSRCDECVEFARSMYAAAQRLGIDGLRPVSERFAGHFLAEHADVAEAVDAKRSVLV